MGGSRGVVLEELEFRILGPLEVVHQGRLLTVTGERQRALLAVLVLHANEVVSADRLLEEVFGDSTPATAQNTLQAAVSRLRKTLGRPDVILTRPRGYVLQVEPGRVDHRRFEQLVEEGRRALERGDAEVAARLLESALEQWRGRPLADVDVGSGAAGDVARLDELRLTALMERIDADLALGRSSQLVGELEALAREHPYQERLRGQLMLALYRSGRQAEALDVYTETRKLLVEALGIEPSRSLQQLERAILRQDPSLDLATVDAPVGETDGLPSPADRPPPPARQPPRRRDRHDLTVGAVGRPRLAALAAVLILLAAAIAAAVIALDGRSASRVVVASNAPRTARSASSSCTAGTPKTALTASPVSRSTLAP